MPGLSIEDVEVADGQFLGAAEAGGLRFVVAGDLDEPAPSTAEIAYRLIKMRERAIERREEQAEERRKLRTDGAGAAAHTLTANGSIPPGYEPRATTEGDGE